MIPLKTILVATDFSAPAEAALQYGRYFAQRHDAALEILHVVDDVASHVVPLAGGIPNMDVVQMDLEAAAQRDLDALTTDDDRLSSRVRTVVLTSATTARAIVSYAQDSKVDLIVVGTHGRGGLANLFMGSVAQHIVRTASCPVLTVRGSESAATSHASPSTGTSTLE